VTAALRHRWQGSDFQRRAIVVAIGAPLLYHRVFAGMNLQELR
jgi:hypothetical protein